ncbi:3-hydroxyacyl-CoA dehydrogenase family protein [Aeromicrobium yanjiei]|uniref:3-hydroxyacyl-CoA dehydrogenase family protein n=1 Tax=Aeromicrobium yanjiei TaxID=2662028 RepID=UPI001FBA00A3|nr:3-hydroxyacyl-CoA dehydrogenase family protein [Aeromicrobium yanjiei]
MASGIVEVFAKAGYAVTFVGRGEDKVAGVVAAITKSLDKAVSRGKLDEDGKTAVLARLTGATDRSALADADIIVEAIAEDLDIKLELFADLDRIAKPGAILATTTSSLSINACAAATQRPQDVIGMHFFNPAAVMKLVEVVTADETSVEVDETVRALCLATGKHPVSCGDRAGFIVNALLFPYLNDAIRLHEAQGTPLDEIDEALKATGLPMGPFQLLDVVGNDVSLAIQRSLLDTFGHAGWRPAATLERLVSEGKLGRKTGAGFHTY